MSEKKVAEITPSGKPDYDVQVLFIHKNSWEEILDHLETLLEGHFMDIGWSGELDINIKFTNDNGQYDDILEAEDE